MALLWPPKNPVFLQNVYAAREGAVLPVDAGSSSFDKNFLDQKGAAISDTDLSVAPGF